MRDDRRQVVQPVKARRHLADGKAPRQGFGSAVLNYSLNLDRQLLWGPGCVGVDRRQMVRQR